MWWHMYVLSPCSTPVGFADLLICWFAWFVFNEIRCLSYTWVACVAPCRTSLPIDVVSVALATLFVERAIWCVANTIINKEVVIWKLFYVMELLYKPEQFIKNLQPPCLVNPVLDCVYIWVKTISVLRCCVSVSQLILLKCSYFR